MNWGLFTGLMAVSITIKWISENPGSMTERVIIALAYLLSSAFAGFIVPNDYTAIGYGVFLAPIAGDVAIKIYHHIQLGRIYGTAAE